MLNSRGAMKSKSKFSVVNEPQPEKYKNRTNASTLQLKVFHKNRYKKRAKDIERMKTIVDRMKQIVKHGDQRLKVLEGEYSKMKK